MLEEAANARRPNWTKNVQRAPTLIDVQKIDAIAYITYRNGIQGSVLIQVRGNEYWCQKFFEHNPWAEELGVICIPIGLTDNQIDIGTRFYKELRARRDNNICHDNWIAEHSSTKLNDHWRGMQTDIEERRTSKITNPLKPTASKFTYKVKWWWACR